MYKLYGSFSANPGTQGYVFFNKQFEYQKIKAIYQPFKIANIENAINAMKTLNILGVGVSQPYKIECIGYLDALDNDALNIGAVNTIINHNGKLLGYNTDWKAIFDTIRETDKPIYILGNGGYAKAAEYACNKAHKVYQVITRHNWNMIDEIRNSIILNCTPLDSIIEHNNIVYYASINKSTGRALAFKQACYQYELYIGEWPNVSIYECGHNK